MQTLLPQIRYWIRTGFVAANKIVSLQMPEVYAIVRGKIGKPVEFGLNWGMTRLRGGFLFGGPGERQARVGRCEISNPRREGPHRPVWTRPARLCIRSGRLEPRQ